VGELQKEINSLKHNTRASAPWWAYKECTPVTQMVHIKDEDLQPTDNPGLMYISLGVDLADNARYTEAGRAAAGTNGQRAEVQGAHKRISRSGEVFVELEVDSSADHHEAAAAQSRLIGWRYCEAKYGAEPEAINGVVRSQVDRVSFVIVQ
jgi:hypothetical protein